MADGTADNPWGAPPEALTLMAAREATPGDEMTLCPDCGIDAWAFEEDGEVVHEEFYVSNDLWDAVCPDDGVVRWTAPGGSELRQGRFVICLGCFERRLGRQLTLCDFLGDEAYDALSDAERTALAQEGPGSPYGRPPSKRYRDSWATIGAGS